MSKDHVTFAFGRFNPVTTGHTKLIDAVKNHAKSVGGDHIIFATQSHDAEKNPLTHDQKVHFIKKMAPGTNVHEGPEAKGILNTVHAMQHLHKMGYKKVTMIAGEDRIKDYGYLAKNNIKGTAFDHVEVKSSGHRDPDAEGVEGMSASKQREHAKAGNFAEFRKGVPVQKHAKELYNAVRKGMKVENVLTHFKAIFLVGGPGSGKDFVVNTVMNEYRTKEICLEKLVYAIQERNNIEDLKDFPSLVVNGNAENIDAVIVTKAVLESMGYDTAMVYVYTSNEESKARNDARIARGSRTISEEVRHEKYENSLSSLHQYTEIFESFVLYDNSKNYARADSESKKEITEWLIELSNTVGGFLSKMPQNEAATNWIMERVLEVGTAATAEFARQITPGQGDTKDVQTYAQADKRTDEVLESGSKGRNNCTCGRTPCICGDKNQDTGGTSVPSASTADRTVAVEEAKEEDGKEDSPKVARKKAYKKGLINPSSNYGSSTNMMVGSQGIGFTAEAEEEKKKKKKLALDQGLKQNWDSANFGNPGAASLTAPWGQTSEAKEPKSLSKIREQVKTK